MELAIFIIGSALLVSIALFSRSKRYAYDVWKHDFERELGFSPEVEDEILIRELYDTNHDIKWAVETYKEVKSVCAK